MCLVCSSVFTLCLGPHCIGGSLTYLPSSAKLRSGSSPMTQPLWARKWHVLSGWSSSCISCTRVMSWYGKVKYLRQKDETTKIHWHWAALYTWLFNSFNMYLWHYNAPLAFTSTVTTQGRKKGCWVWQKRRYQKQWSLNWQCVVEYLLGSSRLTPKEHAWCSSLSISAWTQHSYVVGMCPLFKIHVKRHRPHTEVYTNGSSLSKALHLQ